MTEAAATTPMTREELYARIMRLPPGKREQAIALAAKVYGPKKGKRKRQGPPRDVAQRRAFAGDPAKYFADVLGWWLTPQQERALEVIETHDRVLIAAANNVGKCVAADDVLTLADGSRVDAATLVGREFFMLSIVGGQVVPVGARAEWNGIETVYEIETDNGRRLTRTGNHPLWSTGVRATAGDLRRATADWTPVGSIAVGDLVAVAHGLPTVGVQSLQDAELKVLAYLIGDGCLTKSTPSFSKVQGRQLDEFAASVAELGCSLRRTSTHPNDYRVVGGDGAIGVAPRPRGPSPIAALVERSGLSGAGSREKFVPSAVFSSPRRQLALFLSRLYATDGWASTTVDGVQVGYCTTSERLARDVQHLLLRFGIHAGLHVRGAEYAWTVHIGDADGIQRFADQIGIFGKEDALARCVDRIAERRWNRTGWRTTNCPPGTAWERVRAVRVLPPTETVAIEVPNIHTYLSDFYEHNTWLGSGYAVYRMDVHGSLPDPARGLDEQGAMVLLPGPDHDTIFSSIYRELLMHLRRAVSRGFGMPGEWSEKSVLWRARPDWYVEDFAPPKHVGQDVAHTVSGRHHQNMMAIIEEGQGVVEPIWRAVEGMCSGAGNKIISPFNPTEAHGSAFTRARGGAYHVLHLDAFGHPNVRERRSVIPAAISHTTIDNRVKLDCRDRGPYPDTQPEPDRRDFLYALPPADAEEHGGRTDGVPGHPDGQVRVYRPTGIFQGQVLGQWPDQVDAGLFDPGAVDAAIARWKATPEPAGKPDRVGLDCAREGNDENMAAPAWGESAEAVLRAWAEARGVSEAALAEVVATRRIRVGALVALGKGKGPEIAERVAERFQHSPLMIDEGGVGASVLDHAEAVLGLHAVGVSFGAAAPDPTPGEAYSENLRTAMYLRAALLHARGLVDTPDDPLLREELLAHRVIHKTRSVRVVGEDGVERKELRASVLLIEKKEIKKAIGRSPDRADAYVLALYAPAGTAAETWEVW